jgi:hypothetical protein
MKRTQFGWVIVLIVLPLTLFITFFQNVGQNLWLLWTIMAMVLLLFFRLTISVDDKYVRFTFGIGIIRGKYLIDDIESCSAKSYLPLGWGIRYRPGVMVYNVSGNKAVELIVRGKSNKIWLGTNKPQEIADYINSIRGSVS